MTLYAQWKDVPASSWRWPDFSPAEIACRGTGRLLMDATALDRLQALRDALGRPMIVNSGYRSPEHNRRVGGAAGSMHLQGRAFDISMANHDPALFIAAAKRAGFTGIGTYPRANFVHVDTGPARSWGEPFPPRASRFAFEPPTVPERLAEDRALTGAGLAGASTVAALGLAGLRQKAADAQEALAAALAQLAPAEWVLLGLALAGALLVIRTRLRAWRRPRG